MTLDEWTEFLVEQTVSAAFLGVLQSLQNVPPDALRKVADTHESPHYAACLYALANFWEAVDEVEGTMPPMEDDDEDDDEGEWGAGDA